VKRAAIITTTLVAALLAARFLSSFPLFIAGELGVLVLVALGVNLILGVSGMFSVASPAFLGLGATLTAALLIRGVPLVVAVPLAILVGWVVGGGLGLIALRLAGVYLAIVTLAFLQTFLTFLDQAESWTGGGYGLVVPVIPLGPVGILTVDQVATAAVGIAAAFTAVNYFLLSSRFGRAWIAIKNNPVAAQVNGMNLPRLKTLAFANGSAMITLAGCLQALLLGVTHPSSYSVDVAVQHLSYVVVGGMIPSVLGPVLGPAVLFVIPQTVRNLGSWLEIFYALLMLIILITAPTGLAGRAIGLRQWFLARLADQVERGR
jgi:branched-chain amino acid transport system permease protein